ncbi:CBS domain-containing protein [Clostridium magnum]|uniref:Hypoxic response protein 1 n=1 Tax=Clostridium magnum DSM 2767 TaxID=1121326 RepID=A0A162RMM6_9CLOT|nr:CBS domain-containing protein [Clostridium magnum]KZL90133.1 hypoxic response protein 1 [Clostridium magnum DSM 2767]SHH61762.1 CBS domain-containing protein [Clostridium magnum DSM 2767]
MKVKDIMTKSVISLDSNDTVQKAASIMSEHNIGSVPVCESSNVIGIITDRDIALRCVAEGKDCKNQSVRDIMSSNPAIGTPDMDVQDASRIMSERQIRRLPIVENNSLVGVVSLGDIAVDPKLNNQAEQALSSISEPSTPR